MFIQACLYAPLANVGWITALPMSVVFAWLVWGERVSMREVSLLGVGVLGVALVVSPSFDSFARFGFGEVCALSSATVVGFAARLGRTSVKEADAWSAAVWMLGVTAITATLVAIVLEGGLVLPSIARGPVFALVVGMVAAGSWGSLYGYAHLPTSIATGILTLEAVWAMLVGYLLYSEVPTPVGIIGGALIAWSAYAIKAQQSRVVAATVRGCNR
jgi:drug/metabolite transporter (DMT)-like permease